MKFSIAIPAYKSKYLHDAIESVLQQQYRDFELIILDDCSPEDLKSIVNEFDDIRIHYYRNEQNYGALNVVDNWNRCLTYCTGDYVICMGDDDRLLPCCLYEFEQLITKHTSLNIYHAKTEIVDESGKVFKYQESRPEFETVTEMLYNEWQYGRIQYLGDFCYKLEWLRSAGGYVKFPYAYSSDWTTAALAAKEKGIANGQKTMFQYRVHHETITNRQDFKITAGARYEVWAWYRNFLLELNKEIPTDNYLKLLPELCDQFNKNMLFLQYKNDIKSSHNIFSDTVYWCKLRKKYSLKLTHLLLSALYQSLHK